MGVFIQNIALGRFHYYASLPAANDGLLLVFIKAAGREADATLRDHDTLSALLAAANDECDFTGYSRKALGSVTATFDDSANTSAADAADPTSYTNTGGSAQIAGAAFVCYDPDTTGGTDADIIPLAQILANDVSFDIGSPVTFAFNAAGFAGAG